MKHERDGNLLNDQKKIYCSSCNRLMVVLIKLKKILDSKPKLTCDECGNKQMK